MQIVIDIPEYIYEHIKEVYEHSHTVEATYSYIYHGTPLPKGHGRLKDADMIKTAFPAGEYVRTESVRATIDHEPTLIEADTESED
jgi:hypothetical protein